MAPNRQHLESLLDILLHGAHEIVQRGQQHAPIIFTAKAKPDAIVYVVKIIYVPVMENATHKNMVADLCRQLLSEPETDLVAFVCEGWQRILPRDTAEIPDHVHEGDPGAHEVIMVNLYSKHEQFMTAHPIIRATGQAPRIERTALPPQGSDFVGRFAILTED